MVRRSAHRTAFGGLTGAPWRWIRALVLGLGVHLAVQRVAAAAPPVYSDFERDVIREGIAKTGGGQPDEVPEGKTIERIDVVRLDVFDHRDPIPDFVNVVHTMTRERVVRQELMFEVRAPYVQERVDESARNLRASSQLSLVLIVPLAGSRPDRVRVLVITKDVWSLRLNYNLQIEHPPIASYLLGRVVGPGGGPPKLNYLLLNPSEDNLFGTHTQVGGLFVLDPGSYALGLTLAHRRVGGSRIRAYAGANVIFERSSGQAEGSSGAFLYQQPLFTAVAPWAWATAVVWRNEVTRQYEGGVIRTFDARSTPEPDDIPVAYRSDAILSSIGGTRSYGTLHKYDFSFGLEADRRRYSPYGFEGLPEPVRDEFVAREMPVSDQRIGPFVELRAYQSQFLRTLDANTLDLQEDYRLGHDVILRLYPASSRLASTRDMLGVFSGLSYTGGYLHDGLYRVIGSSTIELEAHERHDAATSFEVRLMSPRNSVGRLVYDGVVKNRYRNYLRRRYSVGGDTRLRGFPSNAFRGGDAVANNLELRSRSVDILSAHIGLALFYDSAGAADSLADLRIHQSAGLGLRILFPQANRIVFRTDWGFPLAEPGLPPWPGAIFFTFGQAFFMPGLASPDLTSEFAVPTE
jgi:hypothetical protein